MMFRDRNDAARRLAERRFEGCHAGNVQGIDAAAPM